MFNKYLKNKSRSEIGALEGWVSIVLNAVMFAGKLIFGLIANSVSLIADAFHTLSDVATSIVVIIGFKVAQKPADREHPYGHGRAETIATLTIAILVAMVGLEFVKMGVERLFSNESVETSPLIITIVAVTVLIKEWMARFARKLGDLINSDTLRAEAMHHRSDMLSSLLVIVALIGVYFHINWLDGVMALGVAVMMLHSGYEIAMGAIDELLGKPPTKETIENIRNKAKEIKGVLNTHDIVVHSYGSKKFISIHIEVSDKETVDDSHHISDQVERLLKEYMGAEVVTHIDPISLEGDVYQNISIKLDEIINNLDCPCAIQDLRIVGDASPDAILFEVSVSVDFNSHEQFKKSVNTVIQSEYPKCIINVDFKDNLNA
jgi:cation diffusion facilitator family transporter